MADVNGIVYWSADDLLVRKVDFNTGQVTTIAGNGKLPSLIQVVPDGVDATSVAVGPQGLALATDGTLFVLDDGRLRTIDQQGRLKAVEPDVFLGFGPSASPPLAPALDGSLFVRDNCGISRINPSTGKRASFGAASKVFACNVFRSPDGRSLLQARDGTVYATEVGVISTVDAVTGVITDVELRRSRDLRRDCCCCGRPIRWCRSHGCRRGRNFVHR